MYQAELKGKLPSSVQRLEDVLTSDVFSFFKYASRETFLSRLVSLVDIDASPRELREAEFLFWPNYDDGTQPDVVIRIGNHYLLFEAKYFSDLGEEDGNRAGQLIREIEVGLLEARNLELEFKAVLVTADSLEPSETLRKVPGQYQKHLKWINWQQVAGILIDCLEQNDSLPDKSFASDLYDLMDKKHLRGFLSFERLEQIPQTSVGDGIFFNAVSARFRGSFLGFIPVLLALPRIEQPEYPLFFSRHYFSYLPQVKKAGQEVFFRRNP